MEIKIIIHSNAPFCGTGYGQQTAIWAHRLASLGHDVAISAFWGLFGTRLSWNGIPIYPGGLSPHGNDVLAGHAADFGADLIILLTDAWVMEKEALGGRRTAAWMPVDCSPLGTYDRNWLTATRATPVAMSRYGAAQLEAAGFDSLYVPHGIDTSVFAPASKTQSRKRPGIPDDAFVIGINAANKDPIRKGFPEQLAAFAMFRAKHPEAQLLIHSTTTGLLDGADLGAMAARLGITAAVRFSDRYKYATGGYSPQDMAAWYNCLDVYSGCAYAEGFGLPIIEAQACGVPVVVTDASAMTELAGPGWKAEGEPMWNAGHQSWWTKPAISEIAAAYEQAFTSAASLSGEARDFALQYDADRVLHEHWAPALKVLEESLTA